MAELADAPDLGSGGVIHAGSIPVTRTTSLRTAYRSQRLFIKQSLLVHSVAAIFQIEPAAQALLRFSPGYHGIFALYQNNAPFLARKTRPVFYGPCKQSAAFSAPRTPA